MIWYLKQCCFHLYMDKHYHYSNHSMDLDGYIQSYLMFLKSQMFLKLPILLMNLMFHLNQLNQMFLKNLMFLIHHLLH